MRIYGKAKQISDNYYEIPYKEYRPDGTLKATGTEDFSGERAASSNHLYSIHTWDGSRRNKGGKKWFETETYVRVDNRDGLKEYAKKQYPDAVEIQIRKCF